MEGGGGDGNEVIFCPPPPPPTQCIQKMFEYGNPQVQILTYATSWVFLTLLSSIWTNCAFKIHSLISFCC